MSLQNYKLKSLKDKLNEQALEAEKAVAEVKAVKELPKAKVEDKKKKSK